jgi:imidazolonepropionase-like amidohydrolase
MKTIAALSAAFGVAVSAASAQTIAIMNGQVHTITNGVIENGDVIIRDGRIAQVGADLSAPEGATVVDASGKVVTPGLFAPYSSLGLYEIGLDAEANDQGPQQEMGFPLGAALNVVDAYNRSSVYIPINRAGGITRALSAPSAGDTLFAGKAAVIDLSGRISSITKADAAQIVVLGYGGAAREGDTRMGSWAVLREYLDEAAVYAAAPNSYAARAREDRFAIADLKALGPVISGNQPLIVALNSENEARNLIRLKNAYRLNVIVLGGSEVWRAASALAQANIPVILDPLYNLPGQFEDLGATLKNAARLNEAGVKISFYSTPSEPIDLYTLTQLAGNAVAEGLPYEAALAALTLNPAMLYGLGNELGSLEQGKRADVVIWDGDPLEVTTQPEAVYIDGRQQDLNNRQIMLRERYRDLSRGDLPFAYRGGE